MFLNHFGNSRYFRLVGKDGALSDFEGLPVCIQQPLEGLGLGFCGNGEALIFPRLRVAPTDHIGLGSVVFGARADAGHTKMLGRCTHILKFCTQSGAKSAPDLRKHCARGGTRTHTPFDTAF